MPAERLKALVDRTPIGRLVTMAEVVAASRFLLENGAMNGINLIVDGGYVAALCPACLRLGRGTCPRP